MNKIKVSSDKMYAYSAITPVPKGQVQFSKILFYLSDDWSERSIIAQFKQGEKVLNRDLNSDNTCYIPSDFDIGPVTVYLKGYDLDGSSVATANGVSIPIVQGAFDGGEPAVPPEPDLYAKLIEEFSKGIDQERISTAVEEYLNENPIQEKDPTVPDWAKQPQKPAYTAQEVGALPDITHIPSTAAEVNAEPSGAVAQHNVSDVAHNDIRLLIQGLSERLSAVADSDDTTLDQLSEIVAYIKSNKSLIDAITTSKVNVSDIVDNLTTNAVNKPLSAAQGVALKALIDALTIPTALSELSEDATHRVVTDAEKATWNAKSNFTGSYNDLTDKPTIPASYTLPIASPTVLGGVQPVTKTAEMTQSVGVDEAGGLWAKEASGGGSGGNQWTHIVDFTVEEDVNELFVINDSDGNTFEYDELFVQMVFASSSNNTEEKSVELKWLFDKSTSKRSNPYELPYAQRKSGTVTHSTLCAATNFPDGKNSFVYVSFQNSKLDNFTSNYRRLSGIRLWPYTQYIAAGTVIRMFGRNHT